MHRVIANTTPLIALANINRLELLRELYGTIIVPQAVIDEIIREPAKQRVRRFGIHHKRIFFGPDFMPERLR